MLSLRLCFPSGKSLQNGPKEYQKKFNEKKKTTAVKLFRFLLKLELSTTIIESSKTKKNKSTWRPQGSRMPVLQTRWLGDWSFLFGAPWHLFLHPKPPEAPNSSAPSRRSLGCFPSNVFFAEKNRQVVSTFVWKRSFDKAKVCSNYLYIYPIENTNLLAWKLFDVHLSEFW